MRCVASSYVYASDIQKCAGYVTQQGKDKAMRFIELTGVRAQIGETKIPHDINLTMDTGDVYGFIGPNDAGKSTTITVMTGPIPASRGVVSVLNADPQKSASAIHASYGVWPWCWRPFFSLYQATRRNLPGNS